MTVWFGSSTSGHRSSVSRPNLEMGVRAQALKSLRSAWGKKIRGMKQMHQATSVRPFDPERVIRVDTSVAGEGVKLDCGPAVFNLCEKANRMPQMYVVVEGSICVRERAGHGDSLQTMWFGTRVGYFRQKQSRLEHVYGVHYDMDERGDGHPVFHAQMGPLMDFADTIRDQFHLGADTVNSVGPVLRNVRIPTAQMDFFSVCTQLCADHLMTVDPSVSDQRVADAFDDVRSACGFLQGAAHRLAHLNSRAASKCYRSSHWYGGS